MLINEIVSHSYGKLEGIKISKAINHIENPQEF